MVTQVGMRQLRDGLTAVMTRVSRGETIEVTKYGKPVALISPVSGDPVERLIASGDVVQVGRPFDVDSIRPLPPTPGFSSSAVLEDDRNGR